MIINSENLVSLPTVSVIVTSFNRSNTISQTLDSILNQKCNFDFEIIVGDDGSSDTSRELLLKYQLLYPTIFKLLFHDTNFGLGGNWATCVKHARGKYLATCDDDDFWHNENKLQLQVDYLDKNPISVMVHTDIHHLNTKNNTITKNIYLRNKTEPPQGYIQKEIFSGIVRICVSTSLIRKEVIDRYVNLDDYVKLKFGIQDWPTWIIISNYGMINYLPVSTCTYRIGHFAITNLNDYDKQFSKMCRDKVMYKYLCDLFPEKLIYVEKDFDIHTYNVLLSLAYKKIDLKKAREFADKLTNLKASNLKIKFTKSTIIFYLYAFLIYAKRKLKIQLS